MNAYKSRLALLCQAAFSWYETVQNGLMELFMSGNFLAKIIEDGSIIFMYGISFFCLLFAAIYYQPPQHKHWIMIIPLILYFIYDLYFRIDRQNKNFSGRDAKEILSSITTTSTYISFFIAAIGILASVIIDKNNISIIKELFKDEWITGYGFLIIALSGVALLFIPVQYTNKNYPSKATAALKNCFFSVLFFEKVIIILIMYLLTCIVKMANI